ncbi:SAGA-associated factor 73 [Sphaceloma murrayae]|uniref:SAGA-associated factor 73 n=1 Tax=Sphaceloma murrayae TaxID=2082308 RepID=A0A2K1QLG2_9PEZI|nr:SAGA-associated factor 73 [Sphaceloma murrayae]
MAPNGTGRKTPSTPKASSTSSTTSSSLIPKSLLDSLAPSKLKLRVPAPKPSQPGSWGAPTSPPPTAPLTLPTTPIALSFTHGRPLRDHADIVKCNHCKRAILRHKARGHVEGCIAKKQEKQRKKKEAKDARDAAARKAERGGVSSSSEDEGGDGADGEIGSGLGAKKTAVKTGAATAGKKRKVEGAGGAGDEGPKKKKKKEEVKAKVKVKAPVDVERQCGVELPQGGQCARSLTCKSHSMGAKRAVPGRSAPYDKLLAEYQRKNQAKLQKAALDAQALPEELAPEGPVDSDEEKDQILAAIARSHPRPLFQPQLVPLRRKYNYVRLKEMLGNALGGRGGGLFSSGGQQVMGNGGGMGGIGGLNGAMSAGSMRGSVDQGRRESMAESVREGSVSAVVRETSVH